MSMYRREWDCCGSVTETDAWEPESCPFCTPDKPSIAAQSVASAAPADKWASEDLIAAVAQGWCSEANSGKEMDSDLAFDIANSVHRFLQAEDIAASPKSALNEEQIMHIWRNLDGLEIIEGKSPHDYEYHVRLAFARAIEARSGVNAQLVEALQTIVKRFGPGQNSEIFSKRHALQKARTALAAAGIQVVP